MARLINKWNPAVVVAGETRAEVRGDARRGDGQERRHRPQIRREGRRQAAAATTTEAAAAAATGVPALSATAADAVGDVRPAVVAAVDVVGVLNDHRELLGVVWRPAAAGEQAGMDAVLRTPTDRSRTSSAKRRTQTRNAMLENWSPRCRPNSDRVCG
jgi:hypothetical protein